MIRLPATAMSLFTYRDFCGDEPLAVSSPLGSMENVSSVESLHTVSPRDEAPGGERAWGAGGSERHRLNDTILSSSSSDEEGDEEGAVTSGHNVEFLLPPPPTFANPPRPPASPSQPGPSGLFSPPQQPPPSAVSPAQTSKLPTRSPQQVTAQVLPTQVPPRPQLRPQPQQVPSHPRSQPQQVQPQPWPQKVPPQPHPQQVPQSQPQQEISQPRSQQTPPQPRPKVPPQSRPQQVPPQPRSHPHQVPPQPRIPGQQMQPRLPGPQTQSRPQQLPSQARSQQLSPQTAARRMLVKPTLQQILPRPRLQYVSQVRPQLPPQARRQVPSQPRPQQGPSQPGPQAPSEPRLQQVPLKPGSQQSLLQTLLQRGPSQPRPQQQVSSQTRPRQVSSQMYPQQGLSQPRLPDPQQQPRPPVPQPQPHPQQQVPSQTQPRPQQQVPSQSRLPMPPTVARPPVPPPRPRPSLPPVAPSSVAPSPQQPPPPPPPESPPLMRPPDFVNSLITVSAETLRRVRSAGGGPWQLLPPVPVPLSQQITGCRAVVPLRRLAPVDLHRWLAPMGRGRTLTRRLTEPTGVPGTRTRSNSSEMTDEAHEENRAPLRRPRGRPRGTKSLSPAVIDRALSAVTGPSSDGFGVKAGDPDAKDGVPLTLAMKVQPHAVKNGSSDSVNKLKEKGRSSKVRSRSSDSHHHSRLGLAPAPVVVTLEMAEVAARALVRSGKRHRDDSRERSHSRGSSKRQRTSRSNSGERDHKSSSSVERDHKTTSNSGERDHKTSNSHGDRSHKSSKSNSTSDVRKASSPSNEKSKRHDHSSSRHDSTKTNIKESSETKERTNEVKTNEVKTKTKEAEVKNAKVQDPIGSKERYEKKAKDTLSKATAVKGAKAEDSKEVKASKDHKAKKSTSTEGKEKDAKAKESGDKETKAKDAKVKEAERSTKSKGVPLFHPPDRPASSSSGSGEVPHASKSSSKKSSSSGERSSTSSAHRRAERHSSVDVDGSSQGRESRSSSPRRSHERHRKRSSDAASSTSGHRSSSAGRSTERSSAHGTRPLTSPCKEIGLPEKMPKLSSSSEGADSGTAVGSEAQGQEASSDNIDSHPNATTTPMPSPERALTPDPSSARAPAPESAWTLQSVADLKPTATSVITEESVPPAVTTADANPVLATTVTSTTISTPKSIAVPVPVSEPATVLATAVSSSMASTLPRVSRWSPAPVNTSSVTPAAHVTPVRTPVTTAQDMITPTSSCESSVAGRSPVTTVTAVTAPTQAVGVDSGSVTAASAGAAASGPGPSPATLMSPVERRAARRAHRRAPPPTAGDAEREAAARRAARRPIVAPGPEPPPPPPPQFPGRPHESSDDEDSLDLSAEIRALQDKYRSSSDEEGETGGAARESGPSRRRGHAPGGPRPRGRSERCLSASSDEENGPAHSGDDELSIFMESDMEWDEAGPSNASQRAGPSAAHDKTRSPFLSSLRPVKQSATSAAGQKLGRPRVGEGWPPQRPGRSPASAGDGWPPKRPGKSPSRGGSSWPPPLQAKEPPSAEGSSNWPPQRLGKPPRRAFGGGGSWPPLKPKREPAAGSDDAWPSLGLTKSADQGSATEDPPRPRRDSGPEQAEDARRGPSPSPSARSGPSPGPSARPALERPWNEIPLTPRQYRGPLLPLPGGGAPRPNPRWRAPGVPPLPTRAWPPVRVRSEGPPLPPLELPTPRFDPSPVKSSRDTPGPKEEQTVGDSFLDGGWKPPSRQERPASPTAPQPQGPKETAVRPIRRDLELEEGEIAEDSPLAPPPDETDANNNVPLDGSGDGGVSSSPPMKSETLPSDVVELLSGYRHFDEPGYCRPFLQMTPCRCPPEKALNTHVLPPPRVLRVSLRRLRDHGRYASALQLVRAACERSQHEPGPLLDAGCLVRLYAAVVEACVCAGEPGAALLLIPDLRSFGIRNPELFRNIIKDQVPCASLAGPLAGLLSALVAGEIELPPAMWQQLLDLCVHSDAAPAAWAAIGRMVEVGVPPLPRLVERALHVTQTAIPEVLARSGWLVVHNVELLTAVRPSARTMFISQLRRRGMDKLADDIEAQLPRPLLDPVPGRRSPRLSASGSGRWSPRSLTPDRGPGESRVPVWDRAADPRTPVRAPVDFAATDPRAAGLERSETSAERAVERVADPRTPISDRSMAPADRAAAPTQERTPDPRASAPERAAAAAQDHAAAQTQDRSTAAPDVPRQSMFSLPMPEGALVAIPRHSPLAFAQSQTPLSPQFSPAESDEKTGTDSETTQSPAVCTRAAPAREGNSTPPQSPTPEEDSFQYNSPMNIKYEVPSVKASPQLTAASHEASHEEGAEGAEAAHQNAEGSESTHHRAEESEEANSQRPQSDLEGDERRSTRSEPVSTRSTPAPKFVRRVPSAELCRPGSVPIQLPTGRQLNFEFEPPSKAATVEFNPRTRSASVSAVEFEPPARPAAIVFEPPSRSAAALEFEPPSRAAKAFVFESPPRPVRPAAAAAAVGAMPVAPGGSEPGRAANAPAWGASNDIPPDQLQLMRVRKRLEQLAAQSGTGAGEVKTEPWRDRAERRRDPRTHSATGANDGMDRTDWRDRVPHHRDPRARADEDRDTKPWRDRDRASQRREYRSRMATLYNKKKERSWTAEEIAEALAQTEAQARTEAKTEAQAAQARPAVFAWTGEKIAQADAMAHPARDEWAELEAKLESESQDDPEAAEVVALVGRLVESLKEAATADDWPAKLYQVLQTMSEDSGRAPILFQRMCAELVAGGSLSHPEQHMLHRLGAALLMTARTDGNWNGAYRVAAGLLSCKISLEASLAAIGPFKGHHPFRLCLAVLEGLMYSGHVNEAYEFADGFGFFPTTSRSQLSVLLPTMCQLHRRLSANGNTAEAYKLLSWMTHRKPRDSKLFGRADYHKLVDQCQLVNGTLLAALRAGITDIALRVHAVAIAQQVQLSPEALRQLLHLRLSSKEHCHVRQLYNTGCNIGVYPQQKVFSPLVVRLPCWMSQEEMLIVLEEYCRAVIAAFGGVPPVQPLTVNLVVADSGPPAPLSTPVSDRPEDAAARLQKACSLVVPALRLQPGGGPLQFVVTAESLADKLMTQAANSRGALPKAPGLVRVWDAPPGR